MDKTQAAKLAQAYQWLAEGKEVEWRYNNGEWEEWNGLIAFPPEFRIKPESKPLLELWANVYENNVPSYHFTKEAAELIATGCAIRVAVHLREVREPDIKATVKRCFLEGTIPGSWTHEYAEQMIRHILGSGD